MNYYKVLLPLVALLMMGCGPSGDSFRLKGSITGMESGEIYIYNTSASNARFDTIRIEGGKFYYGGIADEATPYTIVFPNALEQVIFIGPGEEIEYKAVSNDLNNYTVSGSDENKLLNDFRASIVNASYSDIQAHARTFINENPHSVVSLSIFERYFLMNSHTSNKELQEIIQTLREAQGDNPYYLSLEAKTSSFNQINVGDKFPDITLQKPNKKTINLWPCNESHTLLLFWTTWINDSYDFMARVRQSARECPAGKMRYVLVSIDNEYDRWKSMTSIDSTTIIQHYCDTRAFASQPLRKAGVSDIPTYFIIDSKRKVVAKGTDPKSLSTDLEKYLKLLNL